MKNKLLLLACSAVLFISGNSALANQPRIILLFNDAKGLCKNAGKTQFSFNYQYVTEDGIQYYARVPSVASSRQLIAVPPPEGKSVRHTYVDFEITDQGDCGNMDLDYNNRGKCYLTNLIPESYQNKPYSYKITLIPQATGNKTYGREMYNLACEVHVLMDS